MSGEAATLVYHTIVTSGTKSLNELYTVEPTSLTQEESPNLKIQCTPT